MMYTKWSVDGADVPIALLTDRQLTSAVHRIRASRMAETNPGAKQILENWGVVLHAERIRRGIDAAEHTPQEIGLFEHLVRLSYLGSSIADDLTDAARCCGILAPKVEVLDGKVVAQLYVPGYAEVP